MDNLNISQEEKEVWLDPLIDGLENKEDIEEEIYNETVEEI